MRTRLLALDVDGTLLDPAGELRDGPRAAVAAARDRGVPVVLCTGRRLRSALPIARRLGLSGPIVVNSGALVKDLDTGDTLYHRYLSDDLYAAALELARRVGPPLVYVDGYHQSTDLLTERPEDGHPFQRAYLEDNRAYTRLVEDLARCQADGVILVSTMADAETVGSLREWSVRELGDRVRIHQLGNPGYSGQILELLAPDSGKWSALMRVAESLGVAPDQIAAVGDDANDVEMIACAGLGIAMGNAVAEVRSVADCVVAGNDEQGVVEAIARALDRG